MTLMPPSKLRKPRGRFSQCICVSVYGRTIPEINDSINKALAFAPGYLELRLDYLRNIQESLPSLSNLKLRQSDIVTFRAHGEGGRSRVSAKIRERIILQIISEMSPPIVDVEINTLSTLPKILDSLRTSSSKNCALIASSHNFHETEKASDLRNLILDSSRRYSPSIIKIVRWAKEFNDNLAILSLYNLAEKIKPSRLVAFCAGPLGIFSRIACVSYGSPFTFASLPNRGTAPGQLDVRSTKVLLDSWEFD